jgi:transcription initiation factor TFIIIB Brf1 subunit/transcription initiation factor TFIIB
MDIEQIWAQVDELRVTPEPEPESEWFCRCGGIKVMDMMPVCTSCGLTDDSWISHEPEWNSGGDPDSGNKDPSRVGAPINLDHFSESWGMGTMIVPKTKSYATARMSRIHHHVSMHHRDRALFHAYQQLMDVGSRVLGLPDMVMYSAKIKYKEFNESKLTRGAVRNGVKANCIFQACREHNISRSTKEIADAFGIPVRDLSRTTEIYQEQVPDTEVHVMTASHLVPRFFNDIAIPDVDKGRVKMRVIKICNSLEESVELMGRTPKAIACAVIFIVLTGMGHKIDRSTVCKVCDVSVPTLAKIENIVKAELKDKNVV